MQFGLRPELLAIASTFAPDVILSNSLDLCVSAKLISITTGAPWVATFHEQAPEREALGVATLHLSYSILQPDAVIAGSQFYLERAHRFGCKDRCHLIYHGIDTDRFSPINSTDEVKARYGIARNHALLFSAGRLKARKGFLDLIRAVGILVKMGREVSIVIAGTLNSASTAYFEELKREVRVLGLDNLVHFDDSISYDRIPWLIGGSDIVVQASHEEGLGLSVIEAMSCGRPLVATKILGHTEIIESENQAVLVESGSPDGLAFAIAGLLDDDERRKALGANARSHAVDRFSVFGMIRTTAELLQALANQPTGTNRAY
jgi:glycosyltransferase involved in cell wall biosynthesis